MGNIVNLPNITPDVLNNFEINQGKQKKESAFDTKNYLNTRLSDGETEKEIIIRLLPMNLENGSPFVLTHFHTVKVPKEIFGTEWKSYLCLKKNQDIDHERFGNQCPFCEINAKAYEMAEKETDPIKKKSLIQLSLANKSQESVIVRCIERGHEEDGVKFWKFNLRQDKTDPYNQIMRLYNRKLQKSREKGDKDENILDIFNGRDLIITITKGNAAPQISCDEDITPLSEDMETMKKWIYDTKKWQDVFTPKDYDYLNLVSEKKYSWWDREQGKWVDKADFDERNKNKTAESNKKVEEADLKLKNDTNVQDFVQNNSIVLEDEVEDNEELPF